MSIETLTKKQKEVFDQLLTSKKHPTLHNDLGLTPSGLSFHCKNIYDLLNVTSRVELLLEYKFDGLPLQDIEFAKPLTPFMKEVFIVMTKGFTIKETVEMLDTTVSKVQAARMRIYWSSGCDDMLELLFKCYDRNYEGVQ